MSTVSESDHRIRLALVGAGVIGTIHGAVISELGDQIDLVAVVDLHLERAEKLAAEYGGTAFTSLTDALQAVDIDVVSVCTPTGRHGETAIEALEAGKTGEELDRAARKVIEDAGYGRYFTHRLGHGLGMDGHEHPYLVKGNRKPLVAGNSVTIEPGIYLPEKFGVRIEDDYGVLEKGLASLSVRPQELVVLKG